MDELELLNRIANQDPPSYYPSLAHEHMYNAEDDFNVDFSDDTLFSTNVVNQPFSQSQTTDLNNG